MLCQLKKLVLTSEWVLFKGFDGPKAVVLSDAIFSSILLGLKGSTYGQRAKHTEN